MASSNSSNTFPLSPALSLVRSVPTYTRFGATFEPWEYTDGIDESMSWKKALYDGYKADNPKKCIVVARAPSEKVLDQFFRNI